MNKRHPSMSPYFRSITIVLAAIFGSASSGVVSGQSMQMESAEQPADQMTVGFDQVKTVLRKRCVSCHNADELRGDLNLANLPALLAGSSSGPVVVAGKPNLSMLFTTAAHLEDPVMPPNSPKIPPRELDVIRRWIESGLPEVTGQIPAETAMAAISNDTATEKGEDLTTDEAANNATSPKAANQRDIDGTTIHGMVQVRSVIRPTSISGFATHPTATIAAFSGNGQAVILNILTGELLGAYDFPESDVTALRFSRDGTLLVVAVGVPGLSGTVVGIELSTGIRKFQIGDEIDSILALDISPDNKYIAIGGPSKAVRILRVSDGEILHNLRKHTDWVLYLSFSPDGLLLASADRFGGLLVWETSSGEEFASLRGHVGAVRDFRWNQTGEKITSGGDDSIIRFWDLHQGKLLQQFDSGAGELLSLDMSSSSVVSGGRNRRVSLFDLDGQPINSLELPGEVEKIRLSANGKLACVTDGLGNVHIINIQDFNITKTLTLPVDIRRLEAVWDRLAEAESSYTEPVIASANTPKEATIPAVNITSISELESQSAATLTKMDQLKKTLDASILASQQISQAMESIAQSTSELRQAHRELNAQIATQKSELDQASEQVKQLRSAYKQLASSPSLVRQNAVQVEIAELRQSLDLRIKLLSSAEAMESQLSASRSESDSMSKPTELVEALIVELKTEISKTETALQNISNRIGSNSHAIADKNQERTALQQ